MTSRVTIQDKTEGQFLTFDLKEVLSVLPPIASALCWHLLELDGEGKPTSGLNWLDLQRQLDKAEAGVLYDWKELIALTSGILQSYDLTLLGTHERCSRCPLPIDLTTVRDFILIEAFDSCYWTVTSDIPGIVDTVAANFKETQTEHEVA